MIQLSAKSAAAAIMLFSMPVYLWSQSATTGAIAGIVFTATGDVLAGVAVTLIDAATNQTQTANTSADGSYRFSMLPPGAYQVDFAAPGFRTARMDSVVVSVSEVPTLNATLDPGSSVEPVACKCHFNLASSSTGRHDGRYAGVTSTRHTPPQRAAGGVTRACRP